MRAAGASPPVIDLERDASGCYSAGGSARSRPNFSSRSSSNRVRVEPVVDMGINIHDVTMQLVNQVTAGLGVFGEMLRPVAQQALIDYGVPVHAAVDPVKAARHAGVLPRRGRRLKTVKS